MIQTDHDLLIRIDERTEDLERNFDNHLAHHFRYSILAWTITIGALITAIFALIRG
jgi:hypothetical protein